MFDLELIDSLHKLIAKAQIEEAVTLLLNQLSKGISEYEELTNPVKEIRKEIITISYNWNNLQKKINKGIIDYDKELITNNKIVNSFLDLIDRLPKSQNLYKYLKFQDGIHLNFNTELETNNDKVKFKVQIEAYGKAELKEIIKDFIFNKVEDFEDFIVSIVRKKLNQIFSEKPPITIYLNWDSVYNKVEEPIKTTIQNTIVEILQKYGIKVNFLLIKFQSTPIKDRFRKLTYNIKTLNIQLSTKDKEQGIILIYRLNFNVMSIDEENFYTFISNNYDNVENELDAIKHTIKEEFITQVNHIDYVNFKPTDFEFILNKVKNKVRNTFGLNIEILSLYRIEDHTDEQINKISNIATTLSSKDKLGLIRQILNKQ
ncbi:MAG: hypothetical protein AAF741_04545 [Bacteroidota bacterium]